MTGWWGILLYISGEPFFEKLFHDWLMKWKYKDWNRSFWYGLLKKLGM
jgi:hypothetical protein